MKGAVTKLGCGMGEDGREVEDEVMAGGPNVNLRRDLGVGGAGCRGL